MRGAGKEVEENIVGENVNEKTGIILRINGEVCDEIGPELK